MQLTRKQKLILLGAAILPASYVVHYIAGTAMTMTDSARPPVQQPKGNPLLMTHSVIPTAPQVQRAASPPATAPPAPAPPAPAPAPPAPTVAASQPPAAPAPTTTAQSAATPPAPAPSSVASAQQAGPAQTENLLAPTQHPSALNGIWVGSAALSGRGMCRLRFEFHDDREDVNRYDGFFQLWCSANNLDRIDPEAATFTGTTDAAGLTFKVATLIGADSHGCAPTTLTVIPFGAGQVVGKWTEARCPGGHMIMQRGR